MFAFATIFNAAIRPVSFFLISNAECIKLNVHKPQHRGSFCNFLAVPESPIEDTWYCCAFKAKAIRQTQLRG